MQEITQAEMAKELKLSEGHLSDILRGRRKISRQLAGRIKEKTGLPLDYILEQPPNDVIAAVKAVFKR